MDVQIEPGIGAQGAAPTLADNSLRIVLSRSTDPVTCSFWVGLYKSNGQGTSKELLTIDPIDEAFRYLSETGLADDQPLMVSDNTGDHPRQFFLIPEKIVRKDLRAGYTLILNTLSALGQKWAGLYLAPSLLNLQESKVLLTELVVGLGNSKTEEVYLLAEDIGINQLLNISLTVKETLKAGRNVWIFH